MPSPSLCRDSLGRSLYATLPVVLAVLWTGALLSSTALAQAPDSAGASQRPKADPADVKSPEAIVAAAYDVISGPAGPRDWTRLRSLYLPEARLIPTSRDSANKARHRVLTVEEYIELARPIFAEEDFYERGIHAETDRFGDMAHVFSTYESRRSPDADPFARGINSFQPWYDGERWWIVTVFWHEAREEAPIPERYDESP